MTADDFLFEDYKMKLSYLTSQFDRLWTRFNFFLSVETALFGFLGYLIFDKKNSQAVPYASLIGLVVSAVWYVVSAQDRALVDAYRGRVSLAAKRIADKWKQDLGWYEQEHVAPEAGSGFKSLFSWYWRPISVTRLPVILSLLLAAVWGVILVSGEALIRALA